MTIDSPKKVQLTRRSVPTLGGTLTAGSILPGATLNQARWPAKPFISLSLNHAAAGHLTG